MQQAKKTREKYLAHEIKQPINNHVKKVSQHLQLFKNSKQED